MKARLFPVVMITLLVLVFSAWAVAGTASGKPKLILQITIDQMRGDFPMRYKDRLGEGGFRYLMEKGTHYINAHFQHADTERPSAMQRCSQARTLRTTALSPATGLTWIKGESFTIVRMTVIR